MGDQRAIKGPAAIRSSAGGCGNTGRSSLAREDSHLEREAERMAERALRGQLCAAGTVSASPLRSSPGVTPESGAAGRPLDGETRAFFEPRFGHDFGAVRVFADERAAASARSLGARAYTTGESVVFGATEYAPHTTSGMRLLAHELAHVVQQSALVAHSGDLVQRAPADTGPMCIVPPQPSGEVEVDSVPRGVQVVRGEDAWVITLWDFARGQATPNGAHAVAVQSLTEEANLRVATDPTFAHWAVKSIVGHASPEGEGDYNLNLARERAAAVAGLFDGAPAPDSSGEACGAGVAPDQYPFLRAVDVTIEFARQSFPSRIEKPKIKSTGPGDFGKNVDMSKPGKGVAKGVAEGVKDATGDLLSEHDPGKGPPSVKFEIRKALKGLAEGGGEGASDIVWGKYTAWSHEHGTKELEPQVQAQINALLPEAERMLEEDPTQPIFAVIHTVAKKHEHYEYDRGSARSPTPSGVELAEPVKLSREEVHRTYKTEGPAPGAANVRLIHQHSIRSVELTSQD